MLLEPKALRQRVARSLEAAVVYAHHDKDAGVGVLQEMHYNLVSLRLNRDLIVLLVNQLRDELLPRHCRPSRNLGLQDRPALLSPRHRAIVLHRPAVPQ